MLQQFPHFSELSSAPSPPSGMKPVLSLGCATHADPPAAAPVMPQGQEGETRHQSFTSQVIHITEVSSGQAEIKPSSGASTPPVRPSLLPMRWGKGVREPPFSPPWLEDKPPSAPACFGGCLPTLRAAGDSAWGATGQQLLYSTFCEGSL